MANNLLLLSFILITTFTNARCGCWNILTGSRCDNEAMWSYFGYANCEARCKQLGHSTGTCGRGVDTCLGLDFNVNVCRCQKLEPSIGLFHSYEISWTMLSPPSRPLINVTINEYFVINEKRILTELFTVTQSDSNLEVRQNSSLQMHCVAAYPVAWYKDNKQVSFVQTNNFNHSANGDKTNVVNATSKILAVQNYKSILNINATDTHTGGNYVCKYFESNDGTLATGVNLLINVNPAQLDKLDRPKILQSGFDEIQMAYSTTVVFSFLYFVPAGASFEEYLLSSNGDKIYLYDNKYGFWVRGDALDDKSLWLCIVEIDRAEQSHQGVHQFVIESLSINETTINEKSSLKLNLKRNAAQPVENFHTYSILGSMYEIAFLFGKPISVRKSEIELFAQLPPEQNCGHVRITPDKATEECGIIGISLIDSLSSRNKLTIDGIRIVLNVSKSCRILGQVTYYEEKVLKTKMSYLNITAIEKSVAVPSIQALDGNRQLDYVFVSETETLRCLIPMCDWGSIGWCKRGPVDSCVYAKWKSEIKNLTYSYVGRPDDPLKTVDSVYFQLNNHTLAYDVILSPLTKNHAGEYYCIVGEPLFRAKARLTSNNLKLTVKKPIAPMFKDGKQFLDQDKWLELDGEQTLSCIVVGDPEPSLSWWRYNDDNVRVRMKNITDAFSIAVTEPGVYECRAENRFGKNFRKWTVRYYDGTPILWIAIAVSAVVVFLFATVAIALWRRRRATAALFKELALTLKETPTDGVSVDATAFLNGQADLLPFDQNYEVDRNLFILTKLLGDGEFGKVYKGELKLNDTDKALLVAVKVPRELTNINHHRALIDELKIMTYANSHVNVVSLVGVCTSNIENMQLFVLTEFCDFGSLQDYLIKHWQNFESITPNAVGSYVASPSAVNQLLAYAYQAANGMKYLAFKNIIHRDLALRNLLLTSEHIVKIADFGMSRRHQIAYNKKRFPNVPLPIKWMAYESLVNGEFTHKSDVWSFGIVLWEMFSCQIPYAGQRLDFESLIERLRLGYRLTKPRIATREIFELMSDCWKRDSNSRPNFGDCKRRIGQMLEQTSPALYVLVQQSLQKPSRQLSSVSPLSKSKENDDSSRKTTESVYGHVLSESTQEKDKLSLLLPQQDAILNNNDILACPSFEGSCIVKSYS